MRVCMYMSVHVYDCFLSRAYLCTGQILPKITDGQRFSSSELVQTRVESRFPALNYFENAI
jgi:hypothetical protein